MRPSINEPIETEPIGGCQRWGWGAREMDEGGQKAPASSYKINKFWGCDTQHGVIVYNTVLDI